MGGVRVALLGATGMVGQELLKVLEERRFPLSEIRLAGSDRSVGRTVTALGREVRLERPDASFFRGLDVVFSAVGSDVAKEAATFARAQGAVMIDKSSAFRMDPTVPLVVPEVNGEALLSHEGVIASPNCSTIQLVMALSPLRQLGKIGRVEVSTYQAVSGTGREAVEELAGQVKGDGGPPRIYPKAIAFNVIAKIEEFDENGYSVEEMKLVRETRKILNEPELPVTATAVRVPVFRGHAEAVTVEFDQEISVGEAKAILRETPGIRLVEDPDVPTPLDADGNDWVWVGRVRKDISRPRSLHLFIVSDNLRKGAATNAVQIAERLFGIAR